LVSLVLGVGTRSLANLLHDKKIVIDWNICLQMIRCSSRNASHLHEMKPMFITQNRVKVADFGFAKIRLQSLNETIVGTACHMARGLLLWELFTRSIPFQGYESVQVMWTVA